MTKIAGAVVVGIDGSQHQPAVIDWAVREARLHHRPLVLVHAYDWALLGSSFAEPPYGAVQESLRDNAGRIRDEALAFARTAAPDLDITARVDDGWPARVLVEASQSAALVVVGHRGRGGFSGLLTGAVAAQLATHAKSPVVVVRPSVSFGPHAGRVVVGVDGPPGSHATLEFAFEEASLRGLGLTAVHAWIGPVYREPGDVLPLVYDVTDVEAEETRVLAEALAGWADKYPDVDVRRVVVQAQATHALRDASSGAALLVVGARGHGGFAGLLLGSVALGCLHHAPCPVGIVHPAR